MLLRKLFSLLELFCNINPESNGRSCIFSEEIWFYLFVCIPSRFAYLIKGRKPRTRRQPIIFIQLNKTVCTKKVLNMTTVQHLSTYWHYINDVPWYVYQKHWAISIHTQSSHHVTCYLFIIMIIHFINKHSTTNKNE